MPASNASPQSAGLTATGITATISDYLTANRVAHQVVEHEETTTAIEEARALHRPPAKVAKTVVLHDGVAYVLAVIPASERLDVRKLRGLVGPTRRMRLATEREMALGFPMIGVGATPPFGPMLPMAEIIDRRLLGGDDVVCAGGDHRHALVLDPHDLVSLTKAKVADICVNDH